MNSVTTAIIIVSPADVAEGMWWCCFVYFAYHLVIICHWLHDDCTNLQLIFKQYKLSAYDLEQTPGLDPEAGCTVIFTVYDVHLIMQLLQLILTSSSASSKLLPLHCL
jgi:hypothetical protein